MNRVAILPGTTGAPGRIRNLRTCLRRAFQGCLATVDYDEICWQKATLVLAEMDCD